jgi:hypothetical protein
LVKVRQLRWSYLRVRRQEERQRDLFEADEFSGLRVSKGQAPGGPDRLVIGVDPFFRRLHKRMRPPLKLAVREAGGKKFSSTPGAGRSEGGPNIKKFLRAHSKREGARKIFGGWHKFERLRWSTFATDYLFQQKFWSKSHTASH